MFRPRGPQITKFNKQIQDAPFSAARPAPGRGAEKWFLLCYLGFLVFSKKPLLQETTLSPS